MRALADTSPRTVDGNESGVIVSPHVREQYAIVEARPLRLPLRAAPAPPALGADSAPTDGLAVASAVLGFTAIVPVVSQVLGIGLGVAGLVRIHRARRAGLPRRGRLWAWLGIGSSTFALLAWIAVLAAFAVISHALGQAADSLPLLAR
jgi:hypothetical protein